MNENSLVVNLNSYKIMMISGQYLQIVVKQKGIDVAVALFTPDGKKIVEADSYHLLDESESLSAISEVAGAYLVEVSSPKKTAKTGRYEVRIEELRAATAGDKYQLAGEEVIREVERLQDNGTLEARRKSIEKYYEALELFRKSGARGWEAFALHQIGTVYQSLGETRKALEKYDEALQIRRVIGDRRGEADTLNNIGAVYQSPLGEAQKALEKYDEALQIRRVIGDRRGEAQALNNIGAAYQSLGETQKEIEKYNQALPIFQEVGNRSGEAIALLRIAQVEQKHGNLTQARQTVEQAVDLIESLRTNIVSQGLRASYFASQHKFFESYIDVLMQLHKQNPAAAFDALALAVSERARARSLLELLREARADIRQGIDGSLLERERSLQQLLNAKAGAQFALLNRKHTPAQAEAAAKEITSLTEEYEEIRAQIRKSSPRYAALTQPQPLNLTEIQQQTLDPDTLLLEYSLGDNASYLFVVSHTSITSYQLPKRTEIEAATRRARELLTAPRRKRRGANGSKVLTRDSPGCLVSPNCLTALVSP